VKLANFKKTKPTCFLSHAEYKPKKYGNILKTRSCEGEFSERGMVKEGS
jgi:hypothetical protein